MNENRIVYEAAKESIKKLCSENNFAAEFEERYPFAVRYKAQIAPSLLDGTPPPVDMLRVEVVIAAQTITEIRGSGALTAAVLKKMITRAEACADAFFRAQAEERLKGTGR